MVTTHFWPCRVSWRAAIGHRTCARLGKRNGPILSSSPSVWSSGCPSAWCTYTSPLQSTRRHFIYQRSSDSINWFGPNVRLGTFKLWISYGFKRNVANRFCLFSPLIQPKVAVSVVQILFRPKATISEFAFSHTSVVILYRKTSWLIQRNPWSSRDK